MTLEEYLQQLLPAQQPVYQPTAVQGLLTPRQDEFLNEMGDSEFGNPYVLIDEVFGDSVIMEFGGIIKK
jgi:hypothetical protein